MLFRFWVFPDCTFLDISRKLRKQNSNLPAFPRITPDKTETFAGKWTARVTKIFNQPDGSIIKATRKINKDGSITDKIEHRHK